MTASLLCVCRPQRDLFKHGFVVGLRDDEQQPGGVRFVNCEWRPPRAAAGEEEGGAAAPNPAFRGDVDFTAVAGRLLALPLAPGQRIAPLGWELQWSLPGQISGDAPVAAGVATFEISPPPTQWADDLATVVRARASLVCTDGDFMKGPEPVDFELGYPERPHLVRTHPQHTLL